MAAMTNVKRWHRESQLRHVYAPGVQGGLWILLVFLAAVTWYQVNPMVVLVFLLIALLFPRVARKRLKAED